MMWKKILCTLLIGGSSCQARTFLSAEGRTLEAELVSATATHAILKTGDGKEHTVPLDRLSKADQRFIETWVAEKVAPRVNIRATKSRVKRETEKDADQEGRGEQSKITVSEVKQEEYVIEIEVSNRENRPLEGLKVTWEATIKDRYADDKNEKPETKTGEIDVPLLEPLRSVEMKSEPISLNSATTVTNTTKPIGRGEKITEAEVDRSRQIIDDVKVHVVWKETVLSTFEIK